MSYSNSNLEKIWYRLYGSKSTLVFCFSFFHFDDFLTTFAKDLIQKPPVFITNIKSTHNFLHFHKNLRSKGLLKKVKKLGFLAADSDKCRKEKFWILWICQIWPEYLDSERLCYGKLSLPKLWAVELAILDLKSLWKSIKLWELLISVMKTDGFFIDPW